MKYRRIEGNRRISSSDMSENISQPYPPTRTTILSIRNPRSAISKSFLTDSHFSLITIRDRFNRGTPFLWLSVFPSQFYWLTFFIVFSISPGVDIIPAKEYLPKTIERVGQCIAILKRPCSIVASLPCRIIS